MTTGTIEGYDNDDRLTAAELRDLLDTLRHLSEIEAALARKATLDRLRVKRARLAAERDRLTRMIAEIDDEVIGLPSPGVQRVTDAGQTVTYDPPHPVTIMGTRRF